MIPKNFDRDIMVKEAWAIANVLWNEGRIKGLSFRIDKQEITRLADIMHGTGTSLVASVFAISISFFVFGYKGEWSWGTFCLSLFVVIAHLLHYHFVLKDYETRYISILRDVFYDRKQFEKL